MRHAERVGFVVACVVLAGISARAAALSVVDFRYAPPEWQAAICLPDDPQKSLVDNRGDLLYDFNQGGREFGTRIGVKLAENAVWQKQELLTPRAPIVKTCWTAKGPVNATQWEIVEQAFAVTPGANAAALDGHARYDVILVRVKNLDGRPQTLQPRLIVDTAFGAAARGSRCGQPRRVGHLLLENGRGRICERDSFGSHDRARRRECKLLGGLRRR